GGARAAVRLRVVRSDGGRVRHRPGRRPTWPKGGADLRGAIFWAGVSRLVVQPQPDDTDRAALPHRAWAVRWDAERDHADVRVLPGEAPVVPGDTDVLRFHHRLRARRHRGLTNRRRLWLALGLGCRGCPAAVARACPLVGIAGIRPLPSDEGRPG